MAELAAAGSARESTNVDTSAAPRVARSEEPSSSTSSNARVRRSSASRFDSACRMRRPRTQCRKSSCASGRNGAPGPRSPTRATGRFGRSTGSPWTSTACVAGLWVSSTGSAGRQVGHRYTSRASRSTSGPQSTGSPIDNGRSSTCATRPISRSRRSGRCSASAPAPLEAMPRSRSRHSARPSSIPEVPR